MSRHQTHTSLGQEFFLACLAAMALATTAAAQSVCLPAPRLLTTMPMGGQAGTNFEVTISGQHIEDIESLSFSHPGITATPVLNQQGQPLTDRFLVSIAADCPTGVHEARVMTRLGVSSSRAFNVGSLAEVTRQQANTTLESAMDLKLNAICNAFMTRQAVDYYRFQATKGQRIVVDCAADGIDSKLKPVIIVADADANDLLVERRGGAIDFHVPADGTYVIKVHDLTFSGGPEYFYRLAIQELGPDALVKRLPATRAVSSFSWPPPGLPEQAAIAEQEPNNDGAEAQEISLPCDLSGSFYPAADVDIFEFTAKKGEVWWVEVASERLGRPTDPSIVVQHVSQDADAPVVTDLVELTDILSPVKVSSNGYSYDGPPYNAGSADILGKVEIKQDGVHRLQLSDLFGGTRTDPRNVYRLIVRKAQPDFAVVGWALHMNLRNGDRNALSKPVALRGGSTVAFEVVVVRRDGFNGPVRLTLENLPEGVTATGLTIPAGKTRGILLITAAEDAPRGMTVANFRGHAEIDGKTATRHGHMASMAWPVPNAWSEIPSPRLLADFPVSVSGSELAPITIAAAGKQEWDVIAGQTLKLPLELTRRSEFSGPRISLRAFGAGFEGLPAFDAPLDADSSEAVLDLAKLKTPPGIYDLAFYGTAVARYRYNPDGIVAAELELKQAREQLEQAQTEAAESAKSAKTATDDQKAELEQAAQAAMDRQKLAEQAVAAADKRVKDAVAAAKPKDIADIVVSTPIRIRVHDAEKAEQK